jgi:hypothetical protein
MDMDMGAGGGAGDVGLELEQVVHSIGVAESGELLKSQ